MADLKHRVELIGSKGTDPPPAYTQSGRIGVAFKVLDIGLFLVNHDAFIIRSHIFRLGHHEDAEFEAYANLHLVDDA